MILDTSFTRAVGRRKPRASGDDPHDHKNRGAMRK